MPFTPHQQLTRTELLVLRSLITAGTITHASEMAHRNLATTRVHVRSLHRKTGTHTLSELVVWALDHWHCCVVKVERAEAG
ncbi:MAG: hypothetical protein ACRDG3_09030 [Tepidiformaceae bacterium]